MVVKLAAEDIEALATEDTLAAAVVVKEDNRPMSAAFDQASYLGFGSPSMATPYSLSFAAD